MVDGSLACHTSVTMACEDRAMAEILIVEDEADLASTVRFAFEREGFAVRVAHDGAHALIAAAEAVPDLVVLDLMLPDVSGLEVCRRLRAGRETASVPILMLTARTDEIDRVVGFEVGADDYVAKPFSVRELVLRVRALLRRAQPAATAPPPTLKMALRFGRLEILDDEVSVRVDGTEIALTSLELRLLRKLYDRRGRVQSREALLNEVWGEDKDVSERSVDTTMKRLREKLGAAGGYLETLRGHGYRMVARPPEGAP